MWLDLFAALGLMLVLEGILPFISPSRVRETLRKLSDLEDQPLRIIGLISMIAGLALLYIVR